MDSFTVCSLKSFRIQITFRSYFIILSFLNKCTFPSPFHHSTVQNLFHKLTCHQIQNVWWDRLHFYGFDWWCFLFQLSLNPLYFSILQTQFSPSMWMSIISCRRNFKDSQSYRNANNNEFRIKIHICRVYTLSKVSASGLGSNYRSDNF